MNRRLIVAFALTLALVAGAICAWLYLPRTASTGAAPIQMAAQGGQAITPPLPMATETADDLLPVTATEAVQINASRPFSTLPNVAAAPFKSTLVGEERDRAISCLAIAAIYEAGGSADDQRPVMQVILNRVRHPAYPSSVCDVVFQGSERKTGCQFTFTCDGSLQRWRPSEVTIAAASKLAAEMLDGAVDKRVGLATHYHTNWVVPYWSANLDKVAAVDTHLFFRWKGYWGTSASFRDKPQAIEPHMAQLASFSPAHLPIDADTMLAYDNLPLDDAGISGSGAVALAASATPEVPRPMVMSLLPGTKPGRWSLDAVARCGKTAECRVIGWTDDSRRPAALSADALAASPPDFVYVQVLRNREQKAYWDCAKWAAAGSAECLGSAGETAALATGAGG